MKDKDFAQTAERHEIALGDARVEAWASLLDGSWPVVSAAHPTDRFGPPGVELFRELTGRPVVGVNPQGAWPGAAFSRDPPTGSPGAPLSIEECVEQVEGVRRHLGLGPWVFWGMSGGGWMAQIYARRYPESLAGVVIESACPCFRERLADPACALSPFFPAWREGLERARLLSPISHEEAGAAEDTEWIEVAGVGQVLRRRGGPALLVSPAPLDEAMKSALPGFWSFDSRAWLATIRVPTLVLCGTADPVVPATYSRRIHEAVAGSQLVEIEGAGHVPSAGKHPEAARAFARFVAPLTPRAP